MKQFLLLDSLISQFRGRSDIAEKLTKETHGADDLEPSIFFHNIPQFRLLSYPLVNTSKSYIKIRL